MSHDGHALLALQLVDSELDQLEGRRRRLAERAALADAQAAHQRWRTQRDTHQAALDAAAAAIAAAEEAGAEIDRKKARLDAQLKTVIAPREAEALMHEIEGLVLRHNELDDNELAAMEDQAAAEGAIAELDAIEPPLLDAIAAAQGHLDDTLASLADEEALLHQRRAAADAALGDADRSLYASALKRHGGIGFCRLERHTCSGCHVDLSQVEYEQVVADAASGELPECPHCARYLVV